MLMLGVGATGRSTSSLADIQQVALHHHDILWHNTLSEPICCRFAMASQWEAFLGLHMQGQTNEWTMQRKVRRIITHQNYDRLSFDNDIALMELDSRVTLNQYIWPICLPAPTHDFPPGQEAWITGWGAIMEGGEAAPSKTCHQGRANTCGSKDRLQNWACSSDVLVLTQYGSGPRILPWRPFCLSAVVES